MEKMSVCLWNKWCWWKIVAFAPKMCSADAKCEYLLYLLYKMDDIDTKSKRLFSIFNIQYSIKMWAFASEVSSADAKSEYLLFEMSGNVADKKCKNLFLK